MHPLVTRAKADIFKPLERMNCHVTTTSPLPRSHVHALQDPNWKEAMYKARLVANGRNQQHGIDCDETFSSVVKPATIRTVLSLVVSRDWPIHQLDVKNAFLHGHLSETVYMHQPPGFVDPAHPDYHLLQYFYSMFLSQSKYAEEILERVHMQHCNPCRTPIDTQSKLGPDGDPVSDSTLYRSLAGSLQYLTFTRPDISCAVQQVCLYMHDPREPHIAALKRILWYVHGTLDHGLQLHVSTTTQLTAYTDADWAGCPVTSSRSSSEAEYRGVANVVAETAWIRNILAQVDQESQIKMIQVKEMMQDNDLKNSKSKDKGSRSRSQSMNEQSHYKQDKTKTRQSINVKSHIFNVIGSTEEFEERDLNIGGDC
ncbi:ribonuclease H-like domain-containing protein [Tanacetum coccineum]